MAQQQKKQNRPKQPQDPYAQQAKRLTSAVQRLRGWVGSDPSRTPELADALVAVTEHRLLGHAYTVAAPEAQESVKLSAQLLTANGPIGPYTSVTDAARYVTSVVHLGVIQSAAGMAEPGAETVLSLNDLREQLGELPLVETLAPVTKVWALTCLCRGALAADDVPGANACADAALQRLAEAGLRTQPEAAYVVVDTDRLVSDTRWAAGLAEESLTHLHVARETYDQEVDGRLAQAARLAPALLQRLAEPLYGLYRDLADRLLAVGEVDLGLVTRRQLIELLRGLAARDDTARVQLAGSLADLVADLRRADRAEEAELVAEELAALPAGDQAAAAELAVGLSRGEGGVHWEPLGAFAAYAGAAGASAGAGAAEVEAELQRQTAARLAAEREEARRIEQQRLAEARVAAERREADRREAERVAAERAAAERQAAAQAEAERLAAEQAEAARIAAEEEAERQERKRRREERIEAHRREQERLEAERLEAERLAFEQREAARRAADPAELERLELERLQAELAELERAEAEAVAQAPAPTEAVERDRAEAEAVEQDQTETEAVERDRAEAEALERERRQAEEDARIEAERIAEEQRAEEHAAAERAKAAEWEARRREEERLEAERAAAREETERLAAERLAAERLEAERAEAERPEQPGEHADRPAEPVLVGEQPVEVEPPTPQAEVPAPLADQPVEEAPQEPEAVPAPPVEDELDATHRAWQEARSRGDRKTARALNEQVVELLRPRAERDLAEYGPRLLYALEELSSARLRSGELFASRGPAREAKTLAKALGRR